MKLLGTYAEPIVSLLDKNNRLHTRFVQHGAETGRFASLDPNLQNIPIRTENGMKVRRAFIADKGYSLVSFDYSQIELRVLAALSRDKKLLEIFHSDGDIHTAVASEVFGVAPDKVDKEMRRRAKVINFGIIYGMGVNALKASLGTSQTEARAYLDNYFKMFAGVREYLDRVMAEVREKGYTETFFGRRRTFIGIKSSIPYLRASAERQAMNAPIQGTAADIIKIAMKKVDDRLRVEKLTPHTHLLLQIHDELLYEIEEKYIPQSTVVIREEMERVFADQVPVVVNVKTGTRWGEL
jgi:DNA polymerase-1